MRLFLMAVTACAASVAAQDLPTECLRESSTPEANATTLRGVTYGLDRFIAVGDSGMVVMSTNAVNWLPQPTVTLSNLNAITFGNGTFVAVGDGGVVLRSTNGTDWTAGNAGLSVPRPYLYYKLRGVAFGDGRFVVVTDHAGVLRSSDAITWEPSNNGLSNNAFVEPGLFYGGGLFVICGYRGSIFVSIDGASWTDVSVPVLSTYVCGAYGNGVFLAAGWASFAPYAGARSTNGLNWTTQDGQSGLFSLCYGRGLFVGAPSGTGRIFLTPDGISWTNTVIHEFGSAGGAFFGVGFGMDHFVAVGSGGVIYTSTNGFAWTRRNPEVCPIKATAEGNGIVVAVSGNYGVIYSSEDNIHFTRRRDPGGGSIGFGGGLFAVVGNARMWTSSDGTNWTLVPRPDGEELRSIRHEDGVWVAIGGVILSSRDATNWTTAVTNAGYLTGVIYGNGRFVSFGWKGVIWSSADGTNWVNVSFTNWVNVIPPRDLDEGVFQDGLFSLHGAFGYRGTLVSRDGIVWSNPVQTDALLGIKSASAASPRSLSLAGEWGRSYAVQASWNLKDWFDALNFTNVRGVTTISLSDYFGGPAVFFRVRSQ